VWHPVTGALVKDLKGSVGDVNSLQFFPSSQVLLSGGADAQLRIWSIEHAVSAATLTGHKRAITGSAIVGRGRQVVSCSLDGTCRLWDVSSKKAVSIFGGGSSLDAKMADLLPNAPINDLALLSDVIPLAKPVAPDTATGLEGRLLLSASENGRVYAYDFRSTAEAFAMSLGTAVNAVSQLQSHHVVLGTQDGTAVGLDLRMTKGPLWRGQRNDAPIKSLLAASPTSFWACAGSCRDRPVLLAPWSLFRSRR
jgi:proteasomal ATPase-associated factor 1